MASDPLNFVKAEDYFHDLSSGWTGPTSVTAVTMKPPSDVYARDSWFGVNIHFDDESYAVLQYIRPTVWRLRYDPVKRWKNKDAEHPETKEDEYTDINTRTIVMDHMSWLTKLLNDYLGMRWEAALQPKDPQENYWKFESTITSPPTREEFKDSYQAGPGMKLLIYEKPFRIQALRELTPVKELYEIPPEFSAEAHAKKLKTVWQTSNKTFRVKLDQKHEMHKQIILDLVKAGHGEYIGFGEQGGTAFMKKACYMNYFNCDNMQYQQVYNRGPTDPREPLYHSDPFYLDLNSNPEHANATATFIDNYSQIAVDFGKSNAGYIKLGVRFGGLDAYFFSANNVPDIVRLYTSIVGRPRLKPRYVLGNHQACYGYEDDESIHAVWRFYRDFKIPLDGLHIDVDFQKQFRTFTIDPAFFGGKGRPKRWDNAEKMFDALRNDGIKCSTNITPVISINDIDNDPIYPDGYKTLREGKADNRFVRDERYKDNEGDNHQGVRYLGYDHWASGNREGRIDIDPNAMDKRPEFGKEKKDTYDFGKVWNSKEFYHGGVSYGYYNGTPGHYPDLNDKKTRIWWGKQYQYLFEQGLEFVWQDMTTPAIGEAYGDMKGFPSRLYITSDHGGLSETVPGTDPSKKKLAIELWALYSYNLHKGTYLGLNSLHELVPKRQNKRNFILGRGSYAGMYRYAGLWTGDNASTWDFWKITVSQVLSVGLNGVSIAGADCGGFEPVNDDEKWCSMELLIRWYAGSVLLPWLRNHYVKKKKFDEPENKRRKFFQEPYAYTLHANENPNIPDRWMYYAVEHISRYYIELRYSLIQVLYDAMFDNMLTGLPIAQSMLITDPQDTSFFNESQEFLDNQYIVGHNILVAPIMESLSQIRQAQHNGNAPANRDVYLPLGNDWYPFNLNPYEIDHRSLGGFAEGGSVINYVAEIKEDKGSYPYVMPMYIREGAIIPQLNVTQYVGDISMGPNHIRYNVYPGKKKREYKYKSYLDDGVSRDSAPSDLAHDGVAPPDGSPSKWVKVAHPEGAERAASKYLDPEAKGLFRLVELTNETDDDGSRTVVIRRIKRDGDYSPEPQLGGSYSIVFWYPPGESIDNLKATIGGKEANANKDPGRGMVKVVINEVLGASEKVEVKLSS